MSDAKKSSTSANVPKIKFGQTADFLEILFNKIIRRYEKEDHLLLKDFARSALIELRVLELKD